jgi:DNA-binding beta-propeller fold protein YncE
MSLRRSGRLAAILVLTLLCISCGQVYRPVVIPTTTVPPNPANFHAVFAINSNGSYAAAAQPPAFSFSAGTAMQIDVSGDTKNGVANMGINPTHAAILANNSRVFVASAGSIEPGGVDVITAFTPAFSSLSSGLSNLTTFSLPTAPPGSPAGVYPYLPDFVAAGQSSVFAANYGTETQVMVNGTLVTVATDSIAVLSPSLNTVTNIVYLQGGSHPVALAVAQNTNVNKLYVANQGTNTISSFNTVDMSQNTVAFSGISPVWMVARGDGQNVYVLTQGDGKLSTINSATDAASTPDCAVTPTLCVGAGANFMLYDAHLQRLYVTNPANSTLYVFSASGGPGEAPQLLNAVNLAGTAVTANYPTCGSLCPVSVTALPDGSRVYVASYQLSGCSDPLFSTACKVVPQVTVIDAPSNTVKTTVFPLAVGQGGTTPPSVSESLDCIPSVPYTPVGVPVAGSSTPGFSTRFRLSTAAAADSSRVYVGVCDAGSVAIINTTTNTITLGGNVADTLITNLPAPFGAGIPPANSEPPAQNPIFLLTGQ